MLGSLLVSLGLESGQFKSGLSAAEKEMRSSAKRIEAIGSKMATLGRNMSLGITLPLAAIGVATFKAASDFQELESAFDATFGGMSASVRKWAVETGDAMGRSTQEIQESALSFQQLFSKAFDTEKAAEMSKQFAVLTQDLASFKNLSNEVAQQKLFSGLVGESEPLRAVGVLLSENAVKAKAMALGIASAKGEMSEQAKVTARAAIIMEQLSTAQGDVIRTSGSAANQIKTAKAAFDELQVVIGTKLLPALTPLITKVAELLGAFGRLPSGVQTGILAIAGIAAAMGPLLIVIGGITRALGPMVAAVKVAAATSTAAGVATGTLSASLALLRVRLIAALAVMGPYALAIAAIAGVVYILTTRNTAAAKATGEYAKQADALAKIQAKVADATDKVSTATGKARAEAIANARALQQETRQYLANAQAALIAAEAKASQQRAEARYELSRLPVNSGAGGGPDRLNGVLQRQTRPVIEANANVKQAENNIIEARKEILRLQSIIDSAAPPAVADVGTGADGKGKRGGGSGPSAAEITSRFNDELANYAQQTLSARQRMAKSADEAAEYEMRGVELARVRTIEGIKAEKDYSAVQKARLIDAVENLADFERQGIEFQRQMEIERELADMAQVRFDTGRDLLANEYDMAETQAERKRLALEILALEHEYRRNQLEMVINSKTAGDAEKKRAAAILASLGDVQAGERASVSRGNETSVERYIREINKTPAQINEAIDEIKIRGLENLNDQLVDAVVNFKSLGDVAKNVLKSILADLLRLQIQKSILGPLSKLLGLAGPSSASIGSASSGIGKGASSFGSLFGGPRANGGPVSAGKVYLTGERGPELAIAGRSGSVVSNSDLKSMLGGATTVHIVPSKYFDVVVDGRADRRVAVGAPGIATAAASGVQSNLRQSQARSLP